MEELKNRQEYLDDIALCRKQIDEKKAADGGKHDAVFRQFENCVSAILRFDDSGDLSTTPLSPLTETGMEKCSLENIRRIYRLCHRFLDKVDIQISLSDQSMACQSTDLHVGISEKMFAAINFTHHVKQTKYEGGDSLDSVRFLQQFYKAHPEADSKEKMMEKLEKYEEVVKELNRISLPTTETDIKTAPYSAQIEELTGKITADIAGLTAGQSRLFPLGWHAKAGESGHAMLMEIVCEENGSYSCIVHNSGAGLNHHPLNEAGKRQFQLKFADLSQDTLCDGALFTSLLHLFTDPPHFSQSIDATAVYDRIFSLFHGRATLLQNSEIPHHAPQKSGTCFWYVFKSLLENKKDLYCLQAYSLKIFHQQHLINSAFASEEAVTLFLKAAERWADKVKRRNLHDDVEIRQYMDQIQKMQQQCESYRAMCQEKCGSVDLLSENPCSVERDLKRIQHEFKQLNVDEAVNSASFDMQRLRLNLETMSLQEKMQELNSVISSTDHTTIKQVAIRKLLDSIPIPNNGSAYWGKAFTTEQYKELAKRFHSFQKECEKMALPALHRSQLLVTIDYCTKRAMEVERLPVAIIPSSLFDFDRGENANNALVYNTMQSRKKEELYSYFKACGEKNDASYGGMLKRGHYILEYKTMEEYRVEDLFRELEKRIPEEQKKKFNEQLSRCGRNQYKEKCRKLFLLFKTIDHPLSILHSAAESYEKQPGSPRALPSHRQKDRGQLSYAENERYRQKICRGNPLPTWRGCSTHAMLLPSAMEYFEKGWEKLESRDECSWLLTVLLDDLPTLSKDRSHATAVATFLQSAIRFFSIQSPPIKQAMLDLIQMAETVRPILHEDAALPQYDQLLNTLNWPDSREEQAELHARRLLCLLNQPITQENGQDLLTSLFATERINMLPPLIGPESEKAAGIRLRDALREKVIELLYNKKDLDQITANDLKTYWEKHTSQRVANCQGTAPLFTITMENGSEIICNLLLGTVLTPDGKNIPHYMPLDLCSQPHVKELQLEPLRPSDKSGRGIVVTDSKQRTLTVNEKYATMQWGGKEWYYLRSQEKREMKSWLMDREVWIDCSSPDNAIVFDCDSASPSYHIRGNKTVALSAQGEELAELIREIDEPAFLWWKPALCWKEGEREYLTFPAHLDTLGKPLRFELRENGQKLACSQFPDFVLTKQAPKGWLDYSTRGPLFLKNEKSGECKVLFPTGPLKEGDDNVVSQAREERGDHPTSSKAKGPFSQLFEKGVRMYLSLIDEELDGGPAGKGLLKHHSLSIPAQEKTAFRAFSTDEEGRVEAKEGMEWLFLAHHFLIMQNARECARCFSKVLQLSDDTHFEAMKEPILTLLNSWFEENEDYTQLRLGLVAHYALFCRLDPEKHRNKPDAPEKQQLQHFLAQYAKAKQSGKYDQDILPLTREEEGTYYEELKKRYGMEEKIEIPQLHSPIPSFLKEVRDLADFRSLSKSKNQLREIYEENKSVIEAIRKNRLSDPGFLQQLRIYDTKEKQSKLHISLLFLCAWNESDIDDIFNQICCDATSTNDIKEADQHYIGKMKKNWDFSVRREQEEPPPVVMDRDPLPPEKNCLATNPQLESELAQLAIEYQQAITPFNEKAFHSPSQESMISSQNQSARWKEKIIERLNKNRFAPQSAHFIYRQLDEMSGAWRKRTIEDAHHYFLQPEKLDQLHFNETEKALFEKEMTLYLLHDHRAKCEALALNQETPASITRAYAIDETLPPWKKVALLYESQSAITLRGRQPEIIERLMAQNEGNYNSIIEELIMGEGKSKVLLPILAEAQSDGENVPIILVPAELYGNNKTDLQQRSLRTFNQPFQTFSFERNSIHDPDILTSLEQIHALLKQAKKKREAVILVPQTVLAIELAYRELDITKEHPEVLAQLESIKAFFSSHGHALIDEADEVLHCRKEMQFTLGNPSTATKQQQTLLFDLFCELSKKAIFARINAGEEVQSEITEIVSAQVFKLCPQWKNEGLKVLFDNFETKKELLDDETATLLALLKGQYEQLLPLTLQKRANIDFGLSQLQREEVREYAIPFESNLTPKESADFASMWETYNYTLQYYFSQGIPHEKLNCWIAHLKEEAKREMVKEQLENPDVEITPKHSAIYRQFFEESGRDLFALSSSFNSALGYEQDKKLFQYYLQSAVFPAIQTHNRYLSVDGIQLVEMFKQVQGFTGTIENAKTIHDKMMVNRYRQDTEKLLDHLRQSEVQVRPLSADSASNAKTAELLSAVGLNETTKAMIDIEGHFDGIDNFTVAKQLLQYFQEEKVGIDGVLFFNKNRLCLLSNEGTVVPLSGSDIDRQVSQLGIDQSRLFTYYDQAHSRGSDVKQNDDTNAIVLIGSNSSATQLLQGISRLRGLGKLNKSQTITCATTSSLQKKMESTNPDFSSIHEFCQQRESEKLKEDYYHSLRQKLRNCVLQSIGNHPQARAALWQEEVSCDPTLLFQSRLGENAPLDELRSYAKQLIDRVQAHVEENAAVIETIQTQCDAILKKVDPQDLPDKVTVQQHSSVVEREMQTQQETEQQLQLELDVLFQDKGKRLRSRVDHMAWDDYLGNSNSNADNFFLPLNATLFDRSLRVAAFEEAYDFSSDSAQHLPHCLLVRTEDGNSEMILLNYEHDALPFLQQSRRPCALFTTGGTLVTHSPQFEQTLSETEKELLLQAQIASGNLSALRKKSQFAQLLQWIKKEPNVSHERCQTLMRTLHHHNARDRATAFMVDLLQQLLGTSEVSDLLQQMAQDKNGGEEAFNRAMGLLETGKKASTTTDTDRDLDNLRSVLARKIAFNNSGYETFHEQCAIDLRYYVNDILHSFLEKISAWKEQFENGGEINQKTDAWNGMVETYKKMVDSQIFAILCREDFFDEQQHYKQLVLELQNLIQTKEVQVNGNSLAEIIETRLFDSLDEQSVETLLAATTDGKTQLCIHKKLAATQPFDAIPFDTIIALQTELNETIDLNELVKRNSKFGLQSSFRLSEEEFARQQRSIMDKIEEWSNRPEFQEYQQYYSQWHLAILNGLIEKKNARLHSMQSKTTEPLRMAELQLKWAEEKCESLKKRKENNAADLQEKQSQLALKRQKLEQQENPTHDNKAAGEIERTIKRLEREINRLNSSIKELQEDVKECEQNLNEKESEREKRQQEIDALKEKIESEQKPTEEEIKTLEKKRDEIEKRIVKVEETNPGQ